MYLKPLTPKNRQKMASVGIEPGAAVKKVRCSWKYQEDPPMLTGIRAPMLLRRCRACVQQKSAFSPMLSLISGMVAFVDLSPNLAEWESLQFFVTRDNADRFRLYPFFLVTVFSSSHLSAVFLSVRGRERAGVIQCVRTPHPALLACRVRLFSDCSRQLFFLLTLY